ncbi:N-acetylmuramoyl-L-alanine amidase [Paenibacillus sp. BSR1-1]|uniref:peptidoglycan recognition protein family protein n=1 Tax=Paenibacillus sp. BSR1-1 TaxID=3020845 RepID=UPI0025B174C0|nr:N-acetylmuramoyl-L-alanine amidase [Paenibacillus sp. BSR1-1]MDN3019219.1 N-acetylmuramoyl-L-alanine amidase [Paenibacillus sp. BSR1-1]
MEIIQRLIPASHKETRPGIKLVPKYITIHETDNPNPGADAEAHARLQERGNSRKASWHLQVDDHQVIQSIPFNEVAWAAGTSAGNRSSVHLEICVNSDGNFLKAVENAVEVTKQLMIQFNIPITNVVQHNHWSGKDCPKNLRAGSKGITWSDFIDMCRANNTLNRNNNTLNLNDNTLNRNDNTFGTATIDYPKAYGINAYEAPNGLYKRKVPGGTSYRVYAEKDGFFDIGQSTWVKAENVIFKRDAVKVTYPGKVNVYDAPNGNYKKQINSGESYLVYAYKDGYYDLGQSTWVKAEYVKLVK